MKYLYAWVESSDDWIVFTGQTVIERSLSHDAAMKLASFMNSASYLNTSPSERAKRPEKIEFDFDALYLKFPRKIGKKSGIERLRKTINTIEKYNLLNQALDNYISMCDGKEEKYILHFSTFANKWADYLPNDAHPEPTSQMSIDEISRLMDN